MLSESQAVFLHRRLGFMKSLTRRKERFTQEHIGEDRIKSAPSPSSSCCHHRKWQAKPCCILSCCLWSDRDGSSGQRSLHFCKGSPTLKWQDANTDMTSVPSPTLCSFWLDKIFLLLSSCFIEAYIWLEKGPQCSFPSTHTTEGPTSLPGAALVTLLLQHIPEYVPKAPASQGAPWVSTFRIFCKPSQTWSSIKKPVELCLTSSFKLSFTTTINFFFACKTYY